MGNAPVYGTSPWVGLCPTVPQKAADEVYECLVESKRAAGNPPLLPHGLEANRHNLEVAIDCAYKGKLIPRRFTVDELLKCGELDVRLDDLE